MKLRDVSLSGTFKDDEQEQGCVEKSVRHFESFLLVAQ